MQGLVIAAIAPKDTISRVVRFSQQAPAFTQKLPYDGIRAVGIHGLGSSAEGIWLPNVDANLADLKDLGLKVVIPKLDTEDGRTPDDDLETLYKILKKDGRRNLVFAHSIGNASVLGVLDESDVQIDAYLAIALRGALGINLSQNDIDILEDEKRPWYIKSRHLERIQDRMPFGFRQIHHPKDQVIPQKFPKEFSAIVGTDLRMNESTFDSGFHFSAPEDWPVVDKHIRQLLGQMIS